MSRKIKDETANTLVQHYIAPEVMGREEWNMTDWSVGQSITEDSMDNTEIGIAILMTRMAAIERELGGYLGPEAVDSMQLNSSKIDRIIDQIGTYNETNGFSYSKINQILNNLYETTTPTSSTISKIDSIEAEIGGTRNGSLGYNNSKIDILINQLYGPNPISGESRLDNIESTLGSDDDQTGGTIFNRINTLEDTVGSSSDVSDKGTHKERLDLIEETLGIDSGDTSSQDSVLERISVLENTVNNESTGHEGRIAALEEEVGMDGQSGTSLNARVSTLESMKDDIGWDDSVEYTKTLIEQLRETQEQIQNINNSINNVIITTTNTTAADALTCSSSDRDKLSALSNGHLVFIILNKRTIGVANLTIESIKIYLTADIQLKAKFDVNSILSLVYNNGNLYMINPPVAIGSASSFVVANGGIF